MPTPDTCPGIPHRREPHPYSRRTSRQLPGGPCPACARILRQAAARAARVAARKCTTCGRNPVEEGRRTCAECVQARVARGFRPRVREAVSRDPKVPPKE